MRYVEAKMNSDIREWTYRYYVANSLQLAPENKYIQKPLYEFIHPQPEDSRTGAEIVQEIMERAGLSIGD